MNLPRPSANMKEYNRILRERLSRYPECRSNYDNMRKIITGGGYETVINLMPLKMDYEVGSRCNFRCKMCLMSEIADTRPTDMKYYDFLNSLDEQAGLIEVKLQGMGEPLLNKDFFKMVDLAVERYIWVRTTTNGSLLHLDKNYKKMIDSKIGEIQVSIDGATKETFEKIRVGSNFERVVENVKQMNEYAHSKKEAWRTSCWMLVQKDNVYEIKEILDIAEYMRFTRLTYSIAIGTWGKESWEEINREKEVKDGISEELAQELIQLGKQKGIEVTFWDGKDKYLYDEKKDKICSWLFSRAFITADMKVVPCCTICDANTYNMGNAIPFKATWNNEIYKEMRSKHLCGNIPEICKNCYL